VEKTKQCFSLTSTDSGSTSSVDKDVVREQFDKDENTDRGNWAGRFDFVLYLVGSVGQGQINVTFFSLRIFHFSVYLTLLLAYLFYCIVLYSTACVCWHPAY